MPMCSAPPRISLARLLRLLMNETPRVHGDLPAPSPVAQDVAEVVEAARSGAPEA